MSMDLTGRFEAVQEVFRQVGLLEEVRVNLPVFDADERAKRDRYALPAAYALAAVCRDVDELLVARTKGEGVVAMDGELLINVKVDGWDTELTVIPEWTLSWDIHANLLKDLHEYDGNRNAVAASFPLGTLKIQPSSGEPIEVDLPGPNDIHLKLGERLRDGLRN